MKIFKKSSCVIKSADLNIDNRTISGYASVFGEYDNSNDRIFKGAFERSIKEWGPEGKNKIKFYYNHEPSPIGIIKKLYEDDVGLRFVAEFGTYDIGERVYGQVRQGALTEMSVKGQSFNGKVNPRSGEDMRNIQLYDLSVVDFADQELSRITSVSKSAKHNELLSIILKECKKIRDKEVKHNIQDYLLSFFNGETLSEMQRSPIAKSTERTQVDLENILKAELDSINNYKF